MFNIFGYSYHFKMFNEIKNEVKYLCTLCLYILESIENVTTKLMIRFRPTLDYIYKNLII